MGERIAIGLAHELLAYDIDDDAGHGAPLHGRLKRPAPIVDRGASSTAGYIVGGAGLVGLGVGAVAGLIVLDRKSTVDDNCSSDKQCNQTGYDAAESGRTWGTITTIGLAAGAFGVGVGTYLVLSSSREEKPATTLAARTHASGAEAVLTTFW